MSSIDLLKTRLQYHGGNQEQRFINDKLRTLKKALLYSYQAATAVLSDGREFRCLINPDKNKPAYDNKVISIPFKDICLNAERVGKRTEGEVEIGMAPGDVFTWKETDSHWLVYLRFLEEDAYFRSEIRRCDQQINVNDNSYWVYLRGPVETALEWNQKSEIVWNDLNYSMVMYITADENTNNYFSRFSIVRVIDPRYNKEKRWQVVGVDPYYGDGILQVFLKEDFENSVADAVAVENEENAVEEDIDENSAYIDGPTEVLQYSKAYYTIKNASNGHWFLQWLGKEGTEDDEDQLMDLNCTLPIIPLNIFIDKLGQFKLIYRIFDEEDETSYTDITLTVAIKPL